MRKEGWEQELNNYLDDALDTPWEYGSHDCALFAFGALKAMGGVDLGEPWRGKYKTERGALGVMKRFGGADVEECMVKLGVDNELTEIDPAFAQRGDITVCPTEEGPALGIVSLDGRFMAVATKPKGFMLHPIFNAIKAWRT